MSVLPGSKVYALEFDSWGRSTHLQFKLFDIKNANVIKSAPEIRNAYRLRINGATWDARKVFRNSSHAAHWKQCQRAVSGTCVKSNHGIMPFSNFSLRLHTQPDTAGGNMTSNVHNSTIKYFPPIERLVIVNAVKFLEFFPLMINSFSCCGSVESRISYFSQFSADFSFCWQHGNHDAKAFYYFQVPTAVSTACAFLKRHQNIILLGFCLYRFIYWEQNEWQAIYELFIGLAGLINKWNAQLWLRLNKNACNGTSQLISCYGTRFDMSRI